MIGQEAAVGEGLEGQRAAAVETWVVAATKSDSSRLTTSPEKEL